VEARTYLPKRNWLRTLLWAAGPIVLAIGVIVFFVARAGSSDESSGPLPAAPKAPAQPKVDQTIEPEARRVAGQFILTAVARKHTGTSWSLLDPTYPGKEEYTKATWAKGDIPVIPFPVSNLKEARFRVAGRQGKELSLEVGLIPKKGSGVRRAVFDLVLTQHGKRWLVNYWATAYTPPIRAIDQ
jgi:hypothetical protein